MRSGLSLPSECLSVLRALRRENQSKKAGRGAALQDFFERDLPARLILVGMVVILSLKFDKKHRFKLRKSHSLLKCTKFSAFFIIKEM